MILRTIIWWMFKHCFADYVFPFQSSDNKISKMKDVELNEYYRQAKELRDNRAYNQEMEELIRVYYRDLAIKTLSKDEVAAYRLTLKALQQLDKRIKMLGNYYSAPKLQSALKQM